MKVVHDVGKENLPPVIQIDSHELHAEDEVELDSDGFAKSGSTDNFDAMVDKINTQAAAKRLDEPAVVESGALVVEDDAELDSDGFAKSCSTDNFDSMVHKINTQAVAKTVDEPAVIEPGQPGVDSDGFWKSTESGDFDQRALASQAVGSMKVDDEKVEEKRLVNVQGKNVVVENVPAVLASQAGVGENADEKKGKKVILKNKKGEKLMVMEKVSNVGGCVAGRDRTVVDDANDKSSSSRTLAKASRKTVGRNVSAKKSTAGTVKKSNVFDKKKMSKRELDYEPRRKKRRLPDVSCDDELEMVPSHEAVKILFGDRDDNELDSGEVVGGNLHGLGGFVDGDEDVEFNPVGAIQSSQKKENIGDGDVENLSQEINKVNVKSTNDDKGGDNLIKERKGSNARKTKVSKIGSKTSLESESKRPQRMNRVRVKPVQFFGTEPEQAEFGYLEKCDDYKEGDDANAVFMFGEGQGYRKEYNIIPSDDDEFADQYLLNREEKDCRDSDAEDHSLEQMETSKPGPSGLSRKKRKAKKTNKVSATQWGPTQEVVSQNGTTRKIKLGTKLKQSIGKQGKFAYDQEHSLSL